MESISLAALSKQKLHLVPYIHTALSLQRFFLKCSLAKLIHIHSDGHFGVRFVVLLQLIKVQTVMATHELFHFSVKGNSTVNSDVLKVAR